MAAARRKPSDSLNSQLTPLGDEYRELKAELNNLFLMPQPDAEVALKRCEEIRLRQREIVCEFSWMVTRYQQGRSGGGKKSKRGK
jgi:hypothetical protein